MAKTFDYTVSFKGDISNIQQELGQKLKKEIQRIEDNTIQFKFDYSNGIKDLQSKLDLIAKQLDPTIGIQFKYEVNKKLYQDALNELEKLEHPALGKINTSAIEKQKAVIEELLNEMNSLQNQGAMTDYFNFIENGASQAKQEIEKLQSEISELKKELEESNNRYDWYYDFSQAREEVEQLKRQIEDLQNQISTQQNDFFFSGSGLKDEISGVSELETEVGNLNNIVNRSNGRNSSSLGIDNKLLSEIVDSVKEIQKAIGSITEDKSLLSFMEQLNEYVSDLQINLDNISVNGLQNINITMEGNGNAPEVTQYLRKTQRKAQDAYSKLFSAIDPDTVFASLISDKSIASRYNNSIDEIKNLFSQASIDKLLDDPEVQIKRILEFLRLIDEEINNRKNDIAKYKNILLNSELNNDERSRIEEKIHLLENDPTFKLLQEANKKAKISRNENIVNNKIKSLNEAYKQQIVDEALGQQSNAEDVQDNLDENISDIDRIIEKLEEIRTLLFQISEDNSISENINNIIQKLDEFRQSLTDISTTFSNSFSNNSSGNIVNDLKAETNAAKEASKAEEEVSKNRNRKQSKVDSKATEENKALVETYKEINALSKNYYALLQKEANGNLSLADERDLKRIREFNDNLKSYNANLKGSADSIKRVKAQQDKFINSLSQKAMTDYLSSNIENRLTKDALNLNSLSKSPKFAQSFKQEISNLNEEIDAFKQRIASISTEEDFKSLMSDFNNLSQSIMDAKKNLTKDPDMLIGSFKDLAKFNKDIEKTLIDNSAMSNELSSKYKLLQERIRELLFSGTEDSITQRQIENIAIELTKLDTELLKSKKNYKNFADTVKEHLRSINAQFVANYLSIQDWIRYIRTAAQTVTELDTALTELRKVSDATTERLQQSFEKSADTAKELGSSITDVINATADWSRLGYDVDAAEELARVSTLYVNVGDNVTMEDVNQSLISTLQGFQLETDQAESIVDKFNEVANNYAIDTAGLGAALQRSAASFHTANTDLSQSIALITATNATIQDPDRVGNMWKTVSARIRGKDVPIYNENYSLCYE